MEAALTLKIYQSYQPHSEAPERKKEFLGIAGADLVHGLFAILPVTLPMGRNTIGLSTGANHRIFNLLNFIVLGLIFFVFLKFFGYVPTCVLKSLNLTNAYILWNYDRVFSFWRTNRFYQVLVVIVPLCIMLFDVAVVILTALVISWLYYWFEARRRMREYGEKLKIYPLNPLIDQFDDKNVPKKLASPIDLRYSTK